VHVGDDAVADVEARRVPASAVWLNRSGVRLAGAVRAAAHVRTLLELAELLE